MVCKSIPWKLMFTQEERGLQEGLVTMEICQSIRAMLVI